MGNEITPDRIKRFLNNESEEAEAELVSEYLKNNPQVWEQYSKDAELWQNADGRLPETARKLMWRQVVKNTRESKHITLRWMAAASVAVVLLGAYIFFGQKQQENIVAQGAQMAHVAQKHELGNNTAENKTVTLPDGTSVLLKPSAVVYYYDSFPVHRNVYLSGVAYFEVAHDKAHPFTVYADSIGTTALGTHFWVMNNSTNEVTVRLMQGKVVVHSFDKKIAMKDVYLLPGDKVTVNKNTGLALVTRYKKEELKAPLAAAKRKETGGETVWTNSAYTFSKSSLDKVFEKIESRYHVKINFNESDLDEMQFTGKIMYGDSLNVILEAICNMNNLEYRRSGNTIDIKKK